MKPVMLSQEVSAKTTGFNKGVHESPGFLQGFLQKQYGCHKGFCLNPRVLQEIL